MVRLVKGAVIQPLSFLQQILHRLVDLRVLETVEVNLRCRQIGMAERFGDYRNIYPRTLQNGGERVTRNIGSHILDAYACSEFV